MTKWEELSMRDRAQYMRLAVQNGYRDIRTIREAYNKYAEGGPKEKMDEEEGKGLSLLEKAKLFVSSDLMNSFRNIRNNIASYSEEYDDGIKQKPLYSKSNYDDIEAGVPQATYLMDRDTQRKVFLRKGYLEGKEGDYGIVKRAVGNRDIPVYQTEPDDIDRSQLIPIGNVKNLILKNANDSREDILRRNLKHAGTYSGTIYLGTDGNLYGKNWDLNDYGPDVKGKGGDAGFMDFATRTLDSIGSPTVINTGFKRLDNVDWMIADDKPRYLDLEQRKKYYPKYAEEWFEQHPEIQYLPETGKFQYVIPEVTVTAHRKKANGSNLYETGGPKGKKVRKINKNSAEYKNNLRKQRLLNEAGYSVKEDGSWGPYQDKLYKGIFAGTNTDIVSTYKVKAGDSMWRIAHNNGMDLEILQKLNPQIHNNLIHPEDKVIISKKKAAKAYNIKEEWAKEKILNKDNLTAIQSVKHDDNYVVVDKKNATLTVYDPNNNPIYTTHNISTGKSGNDYNTITYVNEKGHIISGKGNESTPAGITKITGVGEYHGYPSFTRGRQTNGKYEDIASSLHFGSVDNKKASNGCVRIGGKELQDLSSLIGTKTNVYTLPEKRGSKFTVKDGKLNFVASNAYGSSEGAHKYWDDYNVHINKEYSPLSIKHKKASEDKTKEANITKYVETLSDSKKKLQKFFNLTSDEYNRLVNIALGIAEQETKFGTSRRKKLKDLTPDIVLNTIRGNSNRSRGITQIKLAGDNAGMQAIYRKLNISEDNINSPEKSAEATLARLAYMYNTEVKGRTFTGANNLEISPYDALLYKWNGHNEQLTKHLATPALNNYIQNVNKYANDFDLYSIRANGGRLMTRI